MAGVSSLPPGLVAAMETAFIANPSISRKGLKDATGCSDGTAQRFLEKRRNGQPPQPPNPQTSIPTPSDNISTEYASDKASIVTVSTKITNLEEALAAANVDLAVWEVERHVVNWWDVTFKTADGSETKRNFQIKVWLKPRMKQPFHLALKELTADLVNKGPVRTQAAAFSLADPHMLEISIFDLHFGKLAWAAETGSDYDIKIAESVFKNAIHRLLTSAKTFDVEKILFPIGSDFLHINSSCNTTANNTPQDVDTRLVKIFKTACRVVIEAIDDCAKIAPVEVVFVPGNHDRETAFYLCAYLEAWYNRHEGVCIDTGPSPRKYVRYGVNLLGLTHGNEEKQADLPLIMAGERPVDWSETTTREWHIGHLHMRKETRFLAGGTHGPVVVRILPSLSAADAWHNLKGYTLSNRAAEGYLWSKRNGYTGHFSANV